MIPITIALVIIQEMSSRMGAVTGKGLSDLIREEFGLRATFLLMLALFVTNFFNIVGEFAGVASSFELFGVSKLHRRAAVRASSSGAIVVHGTYSTRREGVPVGVGCSTSPTSCRACSRTRTGRRRRCRR